MTICSLSVCTACAVDCGRWMSTPRLSSGAVTMKMISSTSITSMYGTTLISALSLRRLRVRPDCMVQYSTALVACAGSAFIHMRLALQDRREFLDEVLVAGLDALELVRV